MHAPRFRTLAAALILVAAGFAAPLAVASPAVAASCSIAMNNPHESTGGNGNVVAKLRYCEPEVQPVSVTLYLLKCPTNPGSDYTKWLQNGCETVAHNHYAWTAAAGDSYTRYVPETAKIYGCCYWGAYATFTQPSSFTVASGIEAINN